MLMIIIKIFDHKISTENFDQKFEKFRNIKKSLKTWKFDYYYLPMPNKQLFSNNISGYKSLLSNYLF